MTRAASIAIAFGLAGCTAAPDDGPRNLPPRGATTGGEDTTFDHDNNEASAWELIDRFTREGPPSFAARMHPCTTLRYATLGNVLASLGVDLDNPAPRSAGALYREGRALLGAPRYAERIREHRAVTTAAAVRLFDIFAAGADEIIAAVPTLPRCRIGAVGARLFDGNECVADGVTCLIGVPAQEPHVEQCTMTIARASNPALGKRLAVAVMLAAAYTCE